MDSPPQPHPDPPGPSPAQKARKPKPKPGRPSLSLGLAAEKPAAKATAPAVKEKAQHAQESRAQDAQGSDQESQALESLFDENIVTSKNDPAHTLLVDFAKTNDPDDFEKIFDKFKNIEPSKSEMSPAQTMNALDQSFVESAEKSLSEGRVDTRSAAGQRFYRNSKKGAVKRKLSMCKSKEEEKAFRLKWVKMELDNVTVRKDFQKS